MSQLWLLWSLFPLNVHFLGTRPNGLHSSLFSCFSVSFVRISVWKWWQKACCCWTSRTDLILKRWKSSFVFFSSSACCSPLQTYPLLSFLSVGLLLLTQRSLNFLSHNAKIQLLYTETRVYTHLCIVSANTISGIVDSCYLNKSVLAVSYVLSSVLQTSDFEGLSYFISRVLCCFKLSLRAF